VIFKLPTNKLNPLIFVSINRYGGIALDLLFRQEKETYLAVLKPILNGRLIPEIKILIF